MRPTFDRRLWILLFIILIQCIATTNQQNIKPQNTNSNQHHQQQHQQHQQHKPAASTNLRTTWKSISTEQKAPPIELDDDNLLQMKDDNKYNAVVLQQQQQNKKQKCAKTKKNCLETKKSSEKAQAQHNLLSSSSSTAVAAAATVSFTSSSSLHSSKQKHNHLRQPTNTQHATLATSTSTTATATTITRTTKSNKPSHRLPSIIDDDNDDDDHHQLSHTKYSPAKLKAVSKSFQKEHQQQKQEHHQKIHIAHRNQHKEVKARHRGGEGDGERATAASKAHESQKFTAADFRRRYESSAHERNRSRREIEAENESSSEDEATILCDNKENCRTSAGAAAPTAAKVAVKASAPSDSVREKAAKIAVTAESSSSLEDFTFPSEQPIAHQQQQPDADDEDEDDDSQSTFIAFHNDSAANFSTILASNDFETLAQLSSAYQTSAASAAAAGAAAGTSSAAVKPKRTRSTVTMPAIDFSKPKEPIIIIDDVEEFDSGTDRERELAAITTADDKSEDYSQDGPIEPPRALPLRPVLPNLYDGDEEMSVKYAEQHSEILLMCEVDLDIAASMWYKNGQVVHAMDRTSRATDYRFIKEANGALTITNVMLEDDGKWQCEAENTRRYTENARPVKLVVLDRPKPPYLLIDSRRLDAGNIFVPVKENSELNLACISEGGNPKPTLTWEVLLSPGVDRHAQKVSAEVLELEEVKSEKDKNAYKINSGAKSEARLPAVYRAHHNARILCVMEHPTLKIRQNASLLLDVQYTPSFAISRTPGFGYPLREGIEVSLKCDVDSNPPSTPRWQKDDGDTPVPQTGDGFLNFTSIRREHSGWYKCTSRHLNFQYSSIGYYLSVRYDSVDVTSEPDDQDISVAAASHNPNKGQLEVQLGGAVTLQCPQGSLGCWSHLDPVTARLRGLGHGLTTPTGQFSLKDVVYQDAGTYKCIGQSPTNKKKLEVLQTMGVTVKGAPTVVARNATPVAYPGSPLHLAVEFCANPPAHAARWLHGDRVFTPGNQYGSTVLAYGVTDLPTPYCKEARLTYVSMHERVPRHFYFIVSSSSGVAEATFRVNFTKRYRTITNNAIDEEEEEELSEPEEIHFPVFGSSAMTISTVRSRRSSAVGLLQWAYSMEYALPSLALFFWSSLYKYGRQV